MQFLQRGLFRWRLDLNLILNFVVSRIDVRVDSKEAAQIQRALRAN